MRMKNAMVKPVVDQMKCFSIAIEWNLNYLNATLTREPNDTCRLPDYDKVTEKKSIILRQ